MLETRTIIQAAGQKMDDMQAIIEESSAYEIKGILNSEILFFITIANFLNVDHVIESGRARGQSTELIARFLKRKGGFFDSIEYDDQSQDVSVCARRMSSVGFKVNMLFGNAFEILPNLVKDSKGSALVLLIDGPKGIGAANLALSAIESNKVKAVFIHDIHRDDAQLRSALELWPSFCSSDDVRFVEQFAHIDKPCWEEHQRYERYLGWGPYRRAERKMISYGPTLICLINDLSFGERYLRLKKIKRKLRIIEIRRDTPRYLINLIPKICRKNQFVRKIWFRLLEKFNDAK